MNFTICVNRSFSKSHDFMSEILYKNKSPQITLQALVEERLSYTTSRYLSLSFLLFLYQNNFYTNLNISFDVPA